MSFPRQAGLSLCFAAFAVSAAAAPDPRIVEQVAGSYDPRIETVTKPAGRSLNGCALSLVTLHGKDPVTGGRRPVSLKQYAAKIRSDKTILIVPPTGGENLVDQGWANFFCARGYRALILQHWDQDDVVTPLDLGMHDRGSLRALAAVRHAVEYAQDSGAASIGILGASVGAMTSAFAFGVEPRLRAAVLIVGGKGMPAIIARSTEQTLTSLREQRMKEFGYQTLDEYEAALARAVRIEPSDFAAFSGFKPALAVVALRDDTVPTAAQYALRDAFSAQKTIEIDDVHVEAVKAAYWSHSDAVLEFFRAAL